jgi:predicted kinase
MNKNIYLMMGIPGGGKSTWIRNNVPSDAVICSADHFFEDANGNYNWKPHLLSVAHFACFRKYVIALSDNNVANIVVDNTNTKREFLKNYVVEANKLGFPVTIVAVNADPNVAAQRNVHGVPKETIDSMFSQLQSTLNLGFPENWKIKSVIKVNNL